MNLDGCNRRVVSSFNRTSTGIIVAVSLMWLATASDSLFNLDWGWDKKGLWIAPIIIFVAVVVRVAGHGIFQLVGAMQPRK